MNIYDLIEERRYSNNIAIVVDKNEVTYRQFYCEVDLIERQLGIKSKFCTIGIILANCKEYLYSYFAILKSGNVVTPIYTKLSDTEIINTIKLCNIQTIITDESNSIRLEEMGFCGSIFLIEKRKYKRRKENIYMPLDSMKDIAIMLPTSGSQDKLKRVMLTHDGLYFNTLAHIKSVNMISSEITLILVAMCFGYCNITQILSTIMVEGTIVIYKGNIKIPNIIEVIEKYKVTNFTCIPFILEEINKCNIDKLRINSLRFVCFGGSRIHEDILRKLVVKYKNLVFYQTYGLTEAGPRVTTKKIERNEINISNVGHPIENVTVKIVNENGEECSPLQTGEIIIRSKSLMKGYYNNEDDTNKIMRDGWIWTGDYGQKLENGELLFLGRKYNIVKIMGVSIDLEEIEAVLRNYKYINEVYVYTERKFSLRDIVVAELTTNKPHTNELKHDILLHCKENLSTYKIPAKIIFTNEIEKTYNGKIKRIHRKG